jgi:hypothetical protein
VALLLDVDASEPMGVQPVLEAVDVTVGVRPPRVSVDDRKVVVHPVRARLGLVDDHRADRNRGGQDDGGEAQVHQRDAEPTGNPDAGQCPDERVQ